MLLCRNDLETAHSVSMNKIIADLSERLLITFVKESHEQKYSGGNVFDNHAIGFIPVYMQDALTATKKLHSRSKFTRMMMD